MDELQDTNTITGDLMDEAINNTRKVLDENHLSPEIRQILENQQLTLSFIKIDHKRVNTLFKWYLVQINKAMETRQKVNKINTATWQIVQNVIQWGIITILAYLFFTKP